jgi:putative addiction module component (TIGR02574 family)
MTKSDAEAALLALPLEERIEVARHLWESIEREGEPELVPDWQRKILEVRLSDLEANPDDWLTWDQVKAELAGDPAKNRE